MSFFSTLEMLVFNIGAVVYWRLVEEWVSVRNRYGI